MEDAVDVLEAVARRRAVQGSDTLLIFLLKAARPAKYRERHQVEHSGRLTFVQALASLRHRRDLLEEPKPPEAGPHRAEGDNMKDAETW